MKSVLTEILGMIFFCFLLLPYRQMSSLFLSFLPLLPSLHFLFYFLSSILIPTPLLSAHIHSYSLLYHSLILLHLQYPLLSYFIFSHPVFSSACPLLLSLFISSFFFFFLLFLRFFSTLVLFFLFSLLPSSFFSSLLFSFSPFNCSFTFSFPLFPFLPLYEISLYLYFKILLQLFYVTVFTSQSFFFFHFPIKFFVYINYYTFLQIFTPLGIV